MSTFMRGVECRQITFYQVDFFLGRSAKAKGGVGSDWQKIVEFLKGSLPLDKIGLTPENAERFRQAIPSAEIFEISALQKIGISPLMSSIQNLVQRTSQLIECF